MKPLIFGHTWEEIDAAQRGGTLHRPIVKHSPNPTATQADIDALAEHGLDRLAEMQWNGVIDRLRTSGLV